MQYEKEGFGINCSTPNDFVGPWNDVHNAEQGILNRSSSYVVVVKK
jgi:hypothetical protein